MATLAVVRPQYTRPSSCEVRFLRYSVLRDCPYQGYSNQVVVYANIPKQDNPNVHASRHNDCGQTSQNPEHGQNLRPFVVARMPSLDCHFELSRID